MLEDEDVAVVVKKRKLLRNQPSARPGQHGKEELFQLKTHDSCLYCRLRYILLKNFLRSVVEL